MLLNYSDDGPGPVVVLLHGFPMDMSIWDAQKTTIGSIYRVIAPDLRGHGKSAAPEGTYYIDRMADDIIDLLDALRITERVVLGGLSLGGYIAQSVALRYPDRLRGLMLINTRAKGDSEDAARVREEQAEQVERSGDVEPVVAAMLPKLFAESTRTRRPQLISQLHEVMSRTAPLGVIGALRGMAARPDRTGELASITLPTLVLAGPEDAVVPLAEAEAMAQAIPNSEFLVIPESGHLAPLENPAATNEAILKFLGSLA